MYDKLQILIQYTFGLYPPHCVLADAVEWVVTRSCATPWLKHMYIYNAMFCGKVDMVPMWRTKSYGYLIEAIMCFFIRKSLKFHKSVSNQVLVGHRKTMKKQVGINSNCTYKCTFVILCTFYFVVFPYFVVHTHYPMCPILYNASSAWLMSSRPMGGRVVWQMWWPIS